MKLLLAGFLLAGCSSDMTRAEIEAAKAGCLCVATQCKTVVSASGQAALTEAATTRQITRQ